MKKDFSFFLLLFFSYLFFVFNSIFAQKSGSLEGVVTENGQPVGGVNLILENSSYGAVSQSNGKY
ncbi:MAG: hypothetical protein Q8940_16455, partial [Bacteroidota bacterium]|nr:hypothetical protein [Bacteroidota bacterium]